MLKKTPQYFFIGLFDISKIIYQLIVYNQLNSGDLTNANYFFIANLLYLI